MNEKSYYYGVDIVKVLCAILVVSIHTTAMLDLGQVPYMVFHNYITRFAVPFFFLSSGFFFSLSYSKTPYFEEKKGKIGKYTKRLVRPFILWGAIYFVLGILEQVFIDNDNLYSALSYKLHLLVVESPGGGLWYVEALLLIMLLLYLTVQLKHQETILIIGAASLFLLQGVWGANNYGGSVFYALHNVYYKLFFSERTFLFYGIYFFLGIWIAKYRNQLSKIKTREYFIILCGAYALFVGFSNLPQSVAIAVLTQIVKGCVSVALLLFALSIKNEMIPDSFIKRNARVMSTIIYFSHFVFIYMIKIIFKIMGIEFVSHCTLAFVICATLLLIYSVLVLLIDNRKCIIKRLY